MDLPCCRKLQDISKSDHQAVLHINATSNVGYGDHLLNGSTQLSIAHQQVQLPSSIVHTIEPFTGFLQPQHPFPPPRSSFWTLPSPKPVPSVRVSPEPTVMSHAIRHYGRETNSYTPATYMWDDDPGTAKHYKSRSLQEKKETNATRAHDHVANLTKDMMDRKEETPSDVNNPKANSESSIMIFSRTNARRACENRKVHLRQRRQNRRA